MTSNYTKHRRLVVAVYHSYSHPNEGSYGSMPLIVSGRNTLSSKDKTLLLISGSMCTVVGMVARDFPCRHLRGK